MALETMISLAMIVENEERNLHRMLNHTLKFVDELIAVDSGSADGTLKILEDHKAKIFHRKLNDDFASQRNFAIEQCSNDWILSLDADELASRPFLNACHDICKNADANNIDIIGLARLNFIDSKLVEGKGHRGLDYQYRLYKKHCRWTGAVHEMVHTWKNRIELDIVEGIFIMHLKTSERHAERNDLYEKIEKEMLK